MTLRSDLTTEIEKALTDEVYDGGFGALSPGQFSELVRRLAETAAEVIAADTAPRILSLAEINALPTESVVMSQTDIATFGVYEQRVWQKFGGEPDWQFGYPRHEWQSTDGGFERVGAEERHRGLFAFNRRVTLLYAPARQGEAEGV